MALRASKRRAASGVAGSERNAIANADDAERHVDREQPRPVGDREDAGRDTRPDGGRDRDHHRVVAERASQHAVRVDEPHQRGVDAHDPRCPQPLQHARRRQGEQAAGQRARERGDHEQREADPIDAPVADDLARRGQRQQRHRDRELVGVDHPDRAGRRGPEIVRDGGQGDIGDRAIQHRHHEGYEHGEHGPVPLRHRETILRRHLPDTLAGFAAVPKSATRFDGGAAMPA